MANENTPFGFKPIRHMTGGEQRTNKYAIASAYNASIFRGDVVELTGAGKLIQVAAAENVDNIGVFAGCSWTDAQGVRQTSPYWPADTVGTDIVALVYDDPDLVFEVQCDTLAAADIGALADYDAGAGSAATGRSGRSLVASSTGTSGKALRILDLVPRPDNALGAYAKAEVMFAEHAHAQVVSGVGGV